MTSAARWGALVVAALPTLPLACSPAPVPVAPAPPAPSASAVASAPEPPPHLTDLVDLFPSEPTHEKAAGVIEVSSARFGRGTFVHQTYQLWGGAPFVCPLIRAAGCGSFALHLDASPAPGGDIWPTAAIDKAPTLPAQDSSLRSDLAAPQVWATFAGGRDAVYALRQGGKVIDRIDAQGAVTTFAEDDAMAGWDNLWVIELHDRLLVAGMNASWREERYWEEGSVAPSWQLAEVLPAASGAPRHLGPRTELPMRVIGDRLNAQGARSAMRDGKMASLRLPELVALPDEGADKDRWAMAWLEVIPPPYAWPHRRPQRGVSARPVEAPANRPAKKSARHSCGGPPSRDLEDASVTKRAHVTRFAGARLLDDQVRWTGASVGRLPSVQLSPHLDGDQIIVALPSKGRAPSRPDEEDSDSSLSGPQWSGKRGEIFLGHHEEIESLSYDASGREGLAIMRDGDARSGRRFDASGQPVGDALGLGKIKGQIEDAILVDGKWMVHTRSPERLHDLTDQTGPFPIPASPKQRVARLVSVEGRGLLMHVEDRKLLANQVNPAGVSEESTDLGELPNDAEFYTLRVLPMDGGMAVAFLVGLEKLVWRRLAPDAPWQTINLPAHSLDSAPRMAFHDLHGTTVLTLIGDKQETLFWPRTGKSAPARDFKSDAWPADSFTSGPLLGSGLRLTSEPGPPAHDDALVGLGKSCKHAVMTTPDTVVMVCEHALDPMNPELRVGLRTLHVEPAR